MRIATYRGATGPRTAAVVGAAGAEQLIDLHDATGGAVPAGDLLALLEAGPAALAAAKGVTGGAGVPIGSVELLAPMARPPKLIAAAGNYQAHIVEGGQAPVDKSNKVPKLFIKPSTSVAAPGAAIPMPTTSNTMDWELELGVIIGKRGRNIPVERALEYVAGYTIINDVSARTAEWGLAAERNASEWDLFFDWLNGKWPDGFAPTGPWVVTADEIPDPQALKLTLKVNGETKQDATTEDMIWGCAELIAFASRFMTLEPGDTFATGTPSGVGDASGTYLAVGDVMEGWVEAIGTLVTPVGPSVTETI
jgi:2-keto-4-pentenoate hydratase/2-oxohepta-3-ene-1,7-dioic acid hydratase in catechol pathway